MSIAKSEFIKPYPQECLDGQLGLTAEDLAMVLQTKKEHVVRRFKSLDLNPDNNEDFYFTQTWVKINEGRGRRTGVWVFCVDTCKLIIASYHNEVGRAYFKYLLKCEEFVNKQVPKLISEHEEMKEVINKLSKENKALKKPKKRRTKDKIVEVYKRTETRTDIFGNVETEIVTEKKVHRDLTEEEKRQYEISHITAVQKGCSNKLDKLINEPLREAKRNKLKLLSGGGEQKRLGK